MKFYTSPTGARVPRVSSIISTYKNPGVYDLAKWHSKLTFNEAVKIFNEEGKFLSGGIVEADFYPTTTYKNRQMKRAIQAAYDYRDRAARIGTASHEFFEAYGSGRAFDPSCIESGDEKYVEQASESFIHFYNTYKEYIKIRHFEMRLTCEGFGGTLDGEGEFMGEPCVVDWKTSSQFTYSNILQMAAYRYLGMKKFGHKKMDALVVRLDKFKLKYEIMFLPDVYLRSKFEVFKRLCEIHHLNMWLGEVESLEEPPQLA